MKLNRLSALASLIISSALLIPQALANTEKVIFQAPTPDEKTRFDSPGTEDVPQYALRRLAWYLADLPKLTHDNFTLDTHIERGFANASFPSGPETWVLLDDLNPGRRYEARVCWAATQPTSFGVEAFDLSEVLGDKEDLFPSFTSAFHTRFDPDEPLGLSGFRGSPESRMLLRIQARADYFTEDESLMGNAPPIFVHLVLEPCYLGILPHSATFFGLYIICAVIATVSLFIYISSIEQVRAMKSKGAVIMNEITLGEPDRDGYTSSMNRNSEDMEDREIGGFKGVSLCGFGTEEPSRSVSRGRTMNRGYWGSSAGTVEVSPQDKEAEETQEPEEIETPGRGTPAKGGGKDKGKGGKKSKAKKK